jgi:hypothetical protein
MNGKSKIWALALLLGVLLLGGVAGAAVDRILVRESAAAEARERRDSDRDRRGRYLDWLSAELELTDEQRSQVATIVDSHREQTHALWRDLRPRYEEMKSQLRSEIRDVLTEDQSAAYQALLEREADRHRGRRGRE